MPFDVAPLPVAPFAAATTRVNTWRGRCLDAFARAEASVTDSLVTLAAVPDRGQSIDLPHLIGQRVEALAAALTADGPFAAEGTVSLPPIERFRAQIELRTMLCHGVGKITLDRNGRWTLVLHLSALRCRRLVRETFALTEDEAEQRQDDLCRISKALCAQLGQLRAKIAAG